MPKKPQPSKEDYESDVLDLQRKILKGVQIRNIDFTDKLSGQPRIEFLKYCSEMVGNSWFEQIFPALFFDQLLASVESQNFDEVSFHRATINGISLVKEYFKRQARQYDTEFGGNPEGYDPGKAFEPVRS